MYYNEEEKEEDILLDSSFPLEDANILDSYWTHVNL